MGFISVGSRACLGVGQVGGASDSAATCCRTADPKPVKPARKASRHAKTGGASASRRHGLLAAVWTAISVAALGVSCPPESCTPSGLVGGGLLAAGTSDCLRDDGRFGDLAAHKPFEWFDVAFSDFAATFANLTGWGDASTGRAFASSTGTAPAVLQVGCGNSALAESLYDIGYEDITNVDIREAAIKQMRGRNAVKRPGMSWHCMDARRMTAFSDSSFDIVLDRGTLDHFLAAGAEPSAYFKEVGRLLRPGGAFICVSNGIAGRALFASTNAWQFSDATMSLTLEAVAPMASASRGLEAFSVHLLRHSNGEAVAEDDL